MRRQLGQELDVGAADQGHRDQAADGGAEVAPGGVRRGADMRHEQPKMAPTLQQRAHLRHCVAYAAIIRIGAGDAARFGQTAEAAPRIAVEPLRVDQDERGRLGP